jgi:hypothetical protein
MSRCTGRRCGPEMKIPEDPSGPYRYPPVQCKEECDADSELCKTCMKWKAQYDAGKQDKWHGYIHGEIPAKSHTLGSEWNLTLRAKYAEKMAKAAMGESNAAPKAKKAAKKALEAVAEAKEARIEAVSALKEAEAATNVVVADVLRKSSSPKKAKSARKPRTAKVAKKSSSPGVLAGVAEFYTSSSSPKKAKSARKPRTARRKTAKKSSNLAIYRPASASGSPMGNANYAERRASPYSASPLAGVANFYTNSSSSRPSAGHANQAYVSGSGSGSGSNFSAGSNLLLQ